MARLITLALTLFNFFIAATFAATCSVDKIKADFAKIATDLVTLDNDIQAIPDSGITLSQALKVHNDFGNATASINVATTDLTACQSISEADYNALLDAFRLILDEVKKICQDIISKKPATTAVTSFFAILKQDLQNLADALKALGKAIVALAPVR
ncbi:hypothetical protein L218DRAFT_949780 [Marasmius fiardii PR-910]|nr:hypothetical protein L218DRAFT_949780 [Marasmius fiardii PR-910]